MLIYYSIESAIFSTFFLYRHTKWGNFDSAYLLNGKSDRAVGSIIKRAVMRTMFSDLIKNAISETFYS